MTLPARATPRGVSLCVEVKVRASRTRVIGVKGDRLAVALAAPPVDGAANEALRLALAEYFAVPRTAVHIVSGERHRRKVIEIGGIALERVLAKLAAASA